MCRNTKEELAVEQISGLAYQYDQDFFKEMKAEVGVDLENLVYYRVSDIKGDQKKGYVFFGQLPTSISRKRFIRMT